MRKFVLAVGLVLMASGAQAATLNVIGGQLMGASGVDVGGTLYDVQFLAGTCIDLYKGCDEGSDFTFQTEASAVLASGALLDQVFLDGPLGTFDSDATLTNGCNNISLCVIYTPFRLDVFDPEGLFTFSAVNQSSGNVDFLDYLDSTPSRSQDLTFAGQGHAGYAVWEAQASVPESSTALLLSLGLVGLAARRRSLRS
jgi:hypothetical protein